MKNWEKVISALQRQPGQDDDELSISADVSPRQTVNTICRWLRDAGKVRRERGPRGKIINWLIDPYDASVAPALARASDHEFDIDAGAPTTGLGGAPVVDALLAVSEAIRDAWQHVDVAIRAAIDGEMPVIEAGEAKGSLCRAIAELDRIDRRAGDQEASTK